MRSLTLAHISLSRSVKRFYLGAFFAGCAALIALRSFLSIGVCARPLKMRKQIQYNPQNTYAPKKKKKRAMGKLKRWRRREREKKSMHAWHFLLQRTCLCFLFFCAVLGSLCAQHTPAPPSLRTATLHFDIYAMLSLSTSTLAYIFVVGASAPLPLTYIHTFESAYCCNFCNC